ncbi:MAG: T9SS type A sorting domain-containing protein, partial [candidate division Zixibacteria bacterium]|nr:T9SS type A sorting domain-containing protein [candidate division Zixibacteria bacterium]
PILLAGGDHCDPIVLQYSAVDYEGDQIVFSVEAGVGSIDPNSGVYTYTPTLADVGANILATIGVNSVPAYGGPNTVVLTMNFTNEAPTIVCDPGAVPIGAGRTGRAGFTIDDVDCDPSTVYIGSITPTPLGNIYIDGNEVVFETDPDDALAGTSFTVEVCVTDGLDASCCEVVFDILCCGGMEVKIEKTHNSYQGQHEVVDITLEEIPVDMGGFDFLMAYDASALGLQSAIPGPAFYDPAPDGCGWEYFSFRFGPFGNCGNACPSGMVRVFGMAETNNGPNHPACFMPDSLPATLFTLDFLVSNDRTLECQYAPIQFFWTDCGDNSVSSVDGEVLYVSDHIYEFEGTDITDPYFGFPTYFGVQSECLNPDPDKPTVVNFIDFINGGVDIVCADSIDDRGDINLNGVVNEVADAVLYSNYFVQGISVFNVNVDGQIAASDVNADGITLSVADLVYQIRIITGDAPPYPKVGSELAVYAYENGVMSIDLMMGAAFIVLEGEVHPRLLAENMEMNYAFDGLNTRVLVSKVERGAGFEGDFLAFDARIVSFDGATYDGAPVAAKIVPTSYQLHQNYPNPFNPNTTMSFGLPYGGDYSISIYNVSGQTVASFSGSAEPGTVSIDWDASAQASGVYFYKLDTDDFTDTKKMVLLK